MNPKSSDLLRIYVEAAVVGLVLSGTYQWIFEIGFLTTLSMTMGTVVCLRSKKNYGLFRSWLEAVVMGLLLGILLMSVMSIIVEEAGLVALFIAMVGVPTLGIVFMTYEGRAIKETTKGNLDVTSSSNHKDILTMEDILTVDKNAGSYSPITSVTYADSSTPRTKRIPKTVEMYVWRRDRGRCVKCGSNERLEYDHIVPVSKGGSNTDRNIQLLCEYCNRS